MRQYLNVDIHKQRTIKRLAEKKGKDRIYSIKKSDLIKINRCPLCGSLSLSLISEVYLQNKLNFFSTVACQRCLFTFRSVSPSLFWFKKCWNMIKSSKLEVFNRTVEKDRKQRYQEYYNLLSHYKKSGRFLDVGAAYGTGANLFKQSGFTVETVEPEINKINYIRRKFKIPVVENIEKLVAKKKHYDIILFSQCLEHLDRPDLVLPQLRRLLESDGILYLEVPIIWNYVGWSDALYMAHKNNFSEENLRDLATKNGFEIIREVHYDLWNFGMVLKLNNYPRALLRRPNKTKGKNLDNIRSLYRKDWPVAQIPALRKPIRFVVPYIEQFFQIIILENKLLKHSGGQSGFFSFEPTE